MTGVMKNALRAAKAFLHEVAKPADESIPEDAIAYAFMLLPVGALVVALCS